MEHDELSLLTRQERLGVFDTVLAGPALTSGRDMELALLASLPDTPLLGSAVTGRQVGLEGGHVIDHEEAKMLEKAKQLREALKLPEDLAGSPAAQVISVTPT
jgi:hypothetical protein